MNIILIREEVTYNTKNPKYLPKKYYKKILICIKRKDKFYNSSFRVQVLCDIGIIIAINFNVARNPKAMDYLTMYRSLKVTTQ